MTTEAFEQLRQAWAAQDKERCKALGGALGAIGAGLGVKLYDVDSFGLKNTSGLFTKDVDISNLFRSTKMGQELHRMHDDIKQAAKSVKIAASDSAEELQGPGLPRKSGGGERSAA